MKYFKAYLLSFALILTSAAGLVATQPATVSAACSDRLLTFPAWYRGLQTSDCVLMSPKQYKPGASEEDAFRAYIVAIVLNITEIMIQLVAYICIGFLIYGGYRYIISTGTPDGMTAAKKTITNALIGLVIAIFAVAIVNLVAGLIG